MFKCVSYGYLDPAGPNGFSRTPHRPMPSKKSDDRKLADQANELYWRSGQSVNQIAEVMDLSKSGLYALIRPLPAERACPECGEGLVFPNRTTEQKAIASCLACEYVGASPGPGSEVRPPRKRAVRRPTPATKSNGEPRIDLRGGRVGATVSPKTSDGRSWKSSRILWGSVLLGVAAGLYVTRRIRLLLVVVVALGGAACTPGDSGPDAEPGARLTTRGAGDLLSGYIPSEGFSPTERGGPGLAGLRRPAPGGPTPEQRTLDSLGVNFGTPEAPLRLIEFFDYGCGYCRAFHQNTRGPLHEQYVDPGQLYWKSIPFVTGNWATSVPVSLAAECARDQGRGYYEAITDIIFARQGDWKSASAPEELAEGFAEVVGLDMERYRTCVENDELLWRVQAHTALAEEFSVRGTPTFLVIGFGPIVGALPLETFQRLIDTTLVLLAAEQP